MLRWHYAVSAVYIVRNIQCDNTRSEEAVCSIRKDPVCGQWLPGIRRQVKPVNDQAFAESVLHDLLSGYLEKERQTAGKITGGQADEQIAIVRILRQQEAVLVRLRWVDRFGTKGMKMNDSFRSSTVSTGSQRRMDRRARPIIE